METVVRVAAAHFLGSFQEIKHVFMHNTQPYIYVVVVFFFKMMEASLYDKIMDQQRLEPEFFRVGFYGKKFPFFLRVMNCLRSLSDRNKRPSNTSTLNFSYISLCDIQQLIFNAI